MTISNRICLTKRASVLVVLACLLALSNVFAAIPSPARAEGTMIDPATAPQDCEGEECIYLPSIVIPEPDVPVQRSSGRSQAVSLYRDMYLASRTNAVQWTGKHNPCNPGSTGSAFRNAVLTRVNYFRIMAGVPELAGLRNELNGEEQQAALMMSRNQKLSHSPDSGWACYSDKGRDAAGKSNLALGANGPAAIDLYMDDFGLPTLGHRRWLLYPQTRYAATGDVPASDGYPATNAFRIYDDNLWGERPKTRDGFVAWPPATFVPYQVVYPYWSFAYPNADFSRATVSVTQAGKAVTVKQFATADGFGEPALVWSMESVGRPWPRPAQDTQYQVTVRGVRVGGQTRDFTYTVTIIDPDR